MTGPMLQFHTFMRLLGCDTATLAQDPSQLLSGVSGANCDAMASFLRVFAELQRLEQTGADCYAEACAWFREARQRELQNVQNSEAQ